MMQQTLDALAALKCTPSVGSAAALRLWSYKTGIPALDALIPGWPVGVSEIQGLPSAGKTTLSYLAMAEAQKAGRLAALVDTEHAFAPTWAAEQGVDLDRLLIVQPKDSRDALSAFDSFSRCPGVGVLVFDSTRVTDCERYTPGWDNHDILENIAGVVSATIPRMTENRMAVLMLSQFKDKPGITFGRTIGSTGGLPLEHFSKLRVEIARSATIRAQDGSGEKIDTRKIAVLKNKATGVLGAVPWMTRSAWIDSFSKEDEG